ncbi:MAG: hypothetical protein M3O50_01020 [Myxococcota bacterium]|nr:hypothetical protein [Myxococcota bacterium]
MKQRPDGCKEFTERLFAAIVQPLVPDSRIAKHFGIARLTDDIATACIATEITGAPGRISLALDSNSLDQVAAAVLLHRIDDSLARKLFPFPSIWKGSC